MAKPFRVVLACLFFVVGTWEWGTPPAVCRHFDTDCTTCVNPNRHRCTFGAELRGPRTSCVPSLPRPTFPWPAEVIVGPGGQCPHGFTTTVPPPPSTTLPTPTTTNYYSLVVLVCICVVVGLAVVVSGWMCRDRLVAACRRLVVVDRQTASGFANPAYNPPRSLYHPRPQIPPPRPPNVPSTATAQPQPNPNQSPPLPNPSPQRLILCPQVTPPLQPQPTTTLPHRPVIRTRSGRQSIPPVPFVAGPLRRSRNGRVPTHPRQTRTSLLRTIKK